MEPYTCGILMPHADGIARPCGAHATHAEVGFKDGGPVGKPLVTVPSYPVCAEHHATAPHPADQFPLAVPSNWDEVLQPVAPGTRCSRGAAHSPGRLPCAECGWWA